NRGSSRRWSGRQARRGSGARAPDERARSWRHDTAMQSLHPCKTCIRAAMAARDIYAKRRPSVVAHRLLLPQLALAVKTGAFQPPREGDPMKKPARVVRLTLDRQTIRKLDDDRLAQVAAAAQDSMMCPTMDGCIRR